MENQQSSEHLFGLSISEETKQELKTLATWARITAIAAFVGYGLGLIVAFIGKRSGDFEVSGAAKVGNIIGAIIALAIGVALNLYLFNFAKSTLASIHSADANSLENGFHNLRMYFKFLGILFIIILVCLGLVIVFAVLGALVGGLNR